MATNHQIYLAIGSNVLPRKKYIVGSLLAIQQAFPNQFAFSSVYLTEPFLNIAQPVYYNCCVRCFTTYPPRKLLAFCNSIEANLGRIRSGQKWQSRPIDIDILLYDNDIIREKDLIIPHYDLVNRDFFLVPLLELNQSIVHPESKRPLKIILKDLPVEKRTNPQKILKPTLSSKTVTYP